MKNILYVQDIIYIWGMIVIEDIIEYARKKLPPPEEINECKCTIFVTKTNVELVLGIYKGSVDNNIFQITFEKKHFKCVRPKRTYWMYYEHKIITPHATRN